MFYTTLIYMNIMISFASLNHHLFTTIDYNMLNIQLHMHSSTHIDTTQTLPYLLLSDIYNICITVLVYTINVS